MYFSFVRKVVVVRLRIAAAWPGRPAAHTGYAQDLERVGIPPRITAGGTGPVSNPRHLARTLDRIQRDVSRQEEAAKRASGRTRRFPVSNRLRRGYEALRCLHRKVANQRHDFLHQTTAGLIKEFAALGLEALSIRGGYLAVSPVTGWLVRKRESRRC